MNTFLAIFALLFGLNFFGVHSGKKVSGVEQMNGKSQIKNHNTGTTSIINANPGTVVVLDDTHFSPPR